MTVLSSNYRGREADALCPRYVLQLSVCLASVSALCYLLGALLDLRVPRPQGAFLSAVGRVVWVGMDGSQAWIRGPRGAGASAGCGGVLIRRGGRLGGLLGQEVAQHGTLARAVARGPSTRPRGSSVLDGFGAEGGDEARVLELCSEVAWSIGVAVGGGPGR